MFVWSMIVKIFINNNNNKKKTKQNPVNNEVHFMQIFKKYSYFFLLFHIHLPKGHIYKKKRERK